MTILQSKEKDLQTALQNVTDEHQKSWDEYNLKKVQKADSSLNEIRGMNLTATGINAATTVGAGVAVATGAGAALAPVVLAGSAALTTSMRERADAVYHENAQLFEDTTGGVQYNYNSQFTVAEK